MGRILKGLPLHAAHPTPARFQLGNEVALAAALLVGLWFAVAAAFPHRPVPPAFASPIAVAEPEPATAPEPVDVSLGGQPSNDRPRVQAPYGQDCPGGICPGIPIFRRR